MKQFCKYTFLAMFVIAMVLIIGGCFRFVIEAEFVSWFGCAGILLVASSIPALIYEMMP